MSKPRKATPRPSDLDEFLFAQVGTQANGMTLSLLSLFARNGRDAWTEARRLADLPKAEASLHLAQIIAAAPRSPWALPEATAIAKRLVDALPVQTTSTPGMARFLARLPRWRRQF